jgi:hypothetical protein
MLRYQTTGKNRPGIGCSIIRSTYLLSKIMSRKKKVKVLPSKCGNS